jgi:hypothetical protein
MAVFWVVMLCSLVEVYQRCRGLCCLHHQISHVIQSNFSLYISIPVPLTTPPLCPVTHSQDPKGPFKGPFPLTSLSLLHVIFPSSPFCGMPPISYWLPGLAISRPYSPLVRSRFLPWPCLYLKSFPRMWLTHRLLEETVYEVMDG